ncbi:MAG: DUF6687 family protein [Pyrinomonadaceae bacterium]
MRFEFYQDGLLDVPKLSVDGTVDNSIHFSHWQGNKTPADVKADTSTEIALNVVDSPDREMLTQGITLVTNNHFDTDGVLSVWTMLTGDPALEYRDLLIAAAEAGDFSEFSSETAVKISLAIQGSDSPEPGEPTGSPLANRLEGHAVTDNAREYELVLHEIPRLLADVGPYELLWRHPWERIERALASFARGDSTVFEDLNGDVSVVVLAPSVFSPSGFKPTRHSAPFTAISHHAHGRFFVIATPAEGGWIYRLDYPYYSWAETVVRPRISRSDLTGALARLNELEGEASGQWKLDESEMTSAAKFMGIDGGPASSRLTPDAVGTLIRSELTGTGA